VLWQILAYILSLLDDERVIPARQHLVKLTGSAPKFWETDSKYLKRVTTAEENKVYGKVVPDKAKATEKPEEK